MGFKGQCLQIIKKLYSNEFDWCEFGGRIVQAKNNEQ
jgi:hypothetical protein